MHNTRSLGQGQCVSDDLNVTNCDTEQAPPGMKFDSCFKVAMEFSMGEVIVPANIMRCGIKVTRFDGSHKPGFSVCTQVPKVLSQTKPLGSGWSLCGAYGVMACNSSNYEGSGFTLKKCEANCCDEDKCNGIGAAGPTAPANNGCSHVASFLATLMSITAIFAGFFTH
ncbi:hypothetical protein OS493_031683 [Desmophyllum pertusum]|uniref:Uncharacterized protein n=1 Tax=Desmophyllum pertusum TaxID=174260 RepID=A0A9X0A0K2_9CNID|nr:hypothetical protein OS493_031683 [Desmophyllum pertusum]